MEECLECAWFNSMGADETKHCEQCVESYKNNICIKPPGFAPNKIIGSPIPNEETERVISRNTILEKAKTIINGERQGTYGKPEDSFSVISLLWSAYLGRDLTTADVANMMILMKVARNSSGVYKEDNWVDICGYAAIGGEIQNMYGEREV